MLGDFGDAGCRPMPDLKRRPKAAKGGYWKKYRDDISEAVGMMPCPDRTAREFRQAKILSREDRIVREETHIHCPGFAPLQDRTHWSTPRCFEVCARRKSQQFRVIGSDEGYRRVPRRTGRHLFVSVWCRRCRSEVLEFGWRDLIRSLQSRVKNLIKKRSMTPSRTLESNLLLDPSKSSQEQFLAKTE